MKTLVYLSVLALLLLAGSGLAFGAEASKELSQGRKLYGVIVSVPKGGIGKWNIRGKLVEVTKETVIDKRKGKPEVGAFVEVIGKDAGQGFNAYKIEVKLPKKPGR